MIREGDVLAGQYRIEKLPLGRAVWNFLRAWDLQRDQLVAVFFPPTWQVEDQFARLSREAGISAQIKSEHMLRIFHVGTLDTGAPYSVMEFLVGRDLAQWLSQHGALPIEQAIDFVIQACDAVADAHSRGIVHRDIKPANLFVVERPGDAPSIKVLGWDLSMSSGSASTKPKPADGEPVLGATEATELVGTPLYMSPEQWQDRHVDQRADIWSLGVSLCELLTGQVPFEPTNITHPFALRRHLLSSITSGESLRLCDPFPAIPQGLEAVIRKCLETDRARRYQNIAELAVAVMDFGSERSKALVDRICSFPKRLS